MKEAPLLGLDAHGASGSLDVITAESKGRNQSGHIASRTVTGDFPPAWGIVGRAVYLTRADARWLKRQLEKALGKRKRKKRRRRRGIPDAGPMTFQSFSKKLDCSSRGKRKKKRGTIMWSK